MVILNGYVSLPEGNMVIQWRENGNVMDKKPRHMVCLGVSENEICPTIVNFNGENDDNHDDFFLGKMITPFYPQKNQITHHLHLRMSHHQCFLQI